MADRKSLNLEKIEKGSNLVITKGSFKEGKDCKNGAIMFGVEYYGADANLFIHPGRDTNAVIDKLEETDEGVEITLYHNNDGSYGVSNGTKSSLNGDKKPNGGRTANNSIESQVASKICADLLVAGKITMDQLEETHKRVLSVIRENYNEDDLPF